MSQLSTEDRIAIRELLSRYCYAIDLGRWDGFPDLFTDDCLLDFGSLMGTYEGKDGVRRFGQVLSGIGLFMRHYTTNLVVTGDGTRAQSESYVLAVTGNPGSQSVATGLYRDELVKQDGRWLIRARRATIDRPAD